MTDTALIVEAVTSEHSAGEDDAAEPVVPDGMTDGATDQEPATGSVRTMTLFDYVAMRPSVTRQSKGKKARTSSSSTQLLLFDLFAVESAPPEDTDLAAAPVQHMDLFTNADDQEEVA